MESLGEKNLPDNIISDAALMSKKQLKYKVGDSQVLQFNKSRLRRFCNNSIALLIFWLTKIFTPTLNYTSQLAASFVSEFRDIYYVESLNSTQVSAVLISPHLLSTHCPRSTP
jgi:hypothetical protein